MKTVLVTRAEAQAAATAHQLEAAGYQVLTAPLLDITPIEWALPSPLPQAILITSGNAVPALEASTLPRDLPVYAVGDRTADYVKRVGFTKVKSAAGDAKALARLVKESCDYGYGALLHLAGEAVGGQLAAELAAAGFWVETRIVYKANAAVALPEAAKQALAEGRVDAVLLYSPRSAAIFARLVANPVLRARLDLCCLSSAVAQAAGEGWRHVRVADHPDEASLHKCLAQTEMEL